jgi:hypothetical protein
MIDLISFSADQSNQLRNAFDASAGASAGSCWPPTMMGVGSRQIDAPRCQSA